MQSTSPSQSGKSQRANAHPGNYKAEALPQSHNKVCNIEHQINQHPLAQHAAHAISETTGSKAAKLFVSTLHTNASLRIQWQHLQQLLATLAHGKAITAVNAFLHAHGFNTNYQQVMPLLDKLKTEPGGVSSQADEFAKRCFHDPILSHKLACATSAAAMESQHNPTTQPIRSFLGRHSKDIDINDFLAARSNHLLVKGAAWSGQYGSTVLRSNGQEKPGPVLVIQSGDRGLTATLDGKPLAKVKFSPMSTMSARLTWQKQSSGRLSTEGTLTFSMTAAEHADSTKTISHCGPSFQGQIRFFGENAYGVDGAAHFSGCQQQHLTKTYHPK